MASGPSYLDQLFFVALPYVAFAVFFVGTIWRYIDRGFSYSSLSSQFLENRKHFWGVVPFHYGILVILVGHVIGLLVPRSVLLWNSEPLRLYILETAALIGGIFTVVGMFLIIVRRLTTPKVKITTTPSDWIIYTLLAIQIVSGLAIALVYPWGSSWYASSAAPYLWSIVKLNPDIGFVQAAPHLVKLHVINAFLVIGFFPSSRLVHVLVMPNQYLWRRPQIVRWYGDWLTARAKN